MQRKSLRDKQTGQQILSFMETCQIQMQRITCREVKMENMILDAWNGLSYVEGVLFTFWLFILYYGKVWIDNRFEKKRCPRCGT